MITVCIATYNGARYITEQLASICSQLSEGDEVIVSDDGSTDGTLDVVRAFGDPRIRIVQNESQRCYTANFENALRHAQGDYIFICDQDDVWHPQKVETVVHYLRDEGYQVVAHDAIVTDAALNPYPKTYYQVKGHIFRNLAGNLIRFSFLGCCLAVRKEVLRRALPFPPDHLLCTHDNWLFLCASSIGRAKVLDQPLIYYRRHAGNTSQGGHNEHKPWTFRIHYRLYLIWHLLRRVTR
jgi:glycosyltransferase involved in cell wall biosynthesis